MSQDIEENKVESVEDVMRSNQAILAEIEAMGQDEGAVKNASAAGSRMIRRQIRENGFARRIIKPEPKTNADLDRVLEHSLPVIIEDMEPRSRGAMSLPFGASTDAQFYFEDRFACVFNPLSTPEWTKDINELRTTRMDLRQVITNNSLNDLETQEDGTLIGGVNEIIGSPDVPSTVTGVVQNFTIQGGITRDSYKEVLSKLEDQKLNNGVFLMNRRTAKAFISFDRNELGGDLSQEIFKEGLAALSEAKIFGVPHIFTMKRDLIADGEVYLFTEPGYLGRFYELQRTTMFVEKKKDILRFSAREILSLTIANVLGVAKVTFTG